MFNDGFNFNECLAQKLIYGEAAIRLNDACGGLSKFNQPLPQSGSSLERLPRRLIV